MTTTATRDRLVHETRLFIEHNAASQALLTAPAFALSQAEAAVQLLRNNGSFFEWGTATVASNLTTLNQAAPVVDIDAAGDPVYGSLVNWQTRFKVGDEIVLAGSTNGNNGIKVIASVGSSSLTVSTPFAAAEAGLYYAKTTPRLLQLCEEQRLFVGGYETDTQLRALLLGWAETIQLRGSRSGIITEFNRITNSTSTTLLESVPPLTALGTGVSYTHSTKTLAASSWYTQVSSGSPITIVGSTRGSSGRYTVYGVSGSSVQIGHRANRSTEYVYAYAANKTELLFREDRVNNNIWVGLANQSSSSKTVAFTLTASGATFGTAAVTQGTGTATASGTLATVSLTAGAGSATSRTFSEVRIPVTSLTSASTFTPAITSGSPTAIRLGGLGLCLHTSAGVPITGSMFPWRWGGIVFTGLRSGVDESGLTVYASTSPGWALGVTYPESAEEESYSMAFPDELVVVEVDHRNTAYYTKDDLTTLVRSVLLPADVEGVLGYL